MIVEVFWMKTKISRILSLCLFGLLLSLSAFGCQKQTESEPMYRLTRLIGGGSYEDSSAPMGGVRNI